MDTDSVSDTKSLPRVMGNTEEGELSDIEQYVSLMLIRHCLKNRIIEKPRGLRSYMGWSHIPDVDSALSSSEDNQFAAPKQQPTGKISVNLPTDDWLCRKMDRLNLTLVHGYPSRSSEAGGLQRDQFIKPVKSKVKWYGLHPSQDKPDLCPSGILRLQSLTVLTAGLQGLLLSLHWLQYRVPSCRTHSGSGRRVPGRLHTYVTRIS